mmetsp:Transcript_6473/g.10717  ORF Transcript_6473/g.10717 Transcript_6473/m.10717 type:complete len:122 (-) Transcript_6473:227-592(-)
MDSGVSNCSSVRFGVIEQPPSSLTYLSECDGVVALVRHLAHGPAVELNFERSIVTFLSDEFLFKSTSTSLFLIRVERTMIKTIISSNDIVVMFHLRTNHYHYHDLHSISPICFAIIHTIMN